MPNKLSLTVTKVTAAREDQVFDYRSPLEFSPEVQKISELIEKDPNNGNLWMNKGLALSKQKLYREAIDAFSMAISLNPFEGLYYRHRGHRYLSIYHFRQGVADLELASRLDPTNWAIWYHLGLAYLLIGDYQRAETAYRACYEMTEPENDSYAAIVNWRYLNLMNLGREEEAQEILQGVTADMEFGENFVYQDMILVYKGEKSPEEVLKIAEDYRFADLELSTKGYGIYKHYLFTGQEEKAEELLKAIVMQL